MIRTQYNGAINARVAAQITARISLFEPQNTGDWAEIQHDRLHTAKLS
jgi:hypothetical protein